MILAFSAFFWKLVMYLTYSFIRNRYLQNLKFLYLGNGICPRNCIWQRGKGQYRALSAHSGPINPALRRSYLKPHSLLPAWPRLGQDKCVHVECEGSVEQIIRNSKASPSTPLNRVKKLTFLAKRLSWKRCRWNKVSILWNSTWLEFWNFNAASPLLLFPKYTPCWNYRIWWNKSTEWVLLKHSAPQNYKSVYLGDNSSLNRRKGQEFHQHGYMWLKIRCFRIITVKLDRQEEWKKSGTKWTGMSLSIVESPWSTQCLIAYIIYSIYHSAILVYGLKSLFNNPWRASYQSLLIWELFVAFLLIMLVDRCGHAGVVSPRAHEKAKLETTCILHVLPVMGLCCWYILRIMVITSNLLCKEGDCNNWRWDACTTCTVQPSHHKSPNLGWRGAKR